MIKEKIKNSEHFELNNDDEHMTCQKHLKYIIKARFWGKSLALYVHIIKVDGHLSFH